VPTPSFCKLRASSKEGEGCWVQLGLPAPRALPKVWVSCTVNDSSLQRESALPRRRSKSGDEVDGVRRYSRRISLRWTMGDKVLTLKSQSKILTSCSVDPDPTRGNDSVPSYSDCDEDCIVAIARSGRSQLPIDAYGVQYHPLRRFWHTRRYLALESSKGCISRTRAARSPPDHNIASVHSSAEDHLRLYTNKYSATSHELHSPQAMRRVRYLVLLIRADDDRLQPQHLPRSHCIYLLIFHSFYRRLAAAVPVPEARHVLFLSPHFQGHRPRA
jgi:hypothetical protein